MLDLDAILAALDRLPLAELPAALGQLETAKAWGWSRLMAPPRLEPHVPPLGTNGGPALHVEDVAQRLGVSVAWVYRAARADRFPFARRLGRRLVFDQAGLERWLARQAH